jgi:hypothetical protein
MSVKGRGHRCEVGENGRVLGVIGLIAQIFFSRFSSRESVRSFESSGRDMDELEVEEEDCGNPSVEDVVGLHVRRIEHALNVLSVHFDNQFLGTEDEVAHLTKRFVKTKKLKLRLRVASFSFVQRDRVVASRMSVSLMFLGKNDTDSDDRSIDGENDREVRSVVDRVKDRGGSDDFFEGFERVLSTLSPDERFFFPNQFRERAN